jgi:hypothetical protein
LIVYDNAGVYVIKDELDHFDEKLAKYPDFLKRSDPHPEQLFGIYHSRSTTGRILGTDLALPSNLQNNFIFIFCSKLFSK